MQPGDSRALQERLARLAPAKRAELEAKLLAGASSNEHAQEAGITPYADAGPAPLAYSQRRFWFVDRLDPERFVNNIARAIRLRGPLDKVALTFALTALVERHAALRTVFAVAEGQVVQTVQPPRAMDVPLLDLSTQPNTTVAGEAVVEARRPFDLASDLPIRARLLRVTEQEHVLLLTIHHIVTDGWSGAILDRDLSSLYTAALSGQRASLRPLPVQYTDFVRWQLKQVEAGALDAQLAYWRDQLAGAPAYIPLTTRGRRPEAQTFHGARQAFCIPTATVELLSALGRQHRATPYMVLLAVFAALLARSTGENEVVVGSPVAGRNRPETHDLVGCLINSIAMRIDLGGDPSFAELLARVGEVVRGALANQDLPFDKLVEELKPRRDPRYAPLFQVMFALQNVPAGGLVLGDVEATELSTDAGHSRLDLTMILQPGNDGLRGTVEYNTDLFEIGTVTRLVSHYLHLLDNVLADPDRPLGSIALSAEDELQQLVVGMNATQRAYPRERSIVELFEQQADQAPDALAVRVGDEQLTYGQLEARANQLARALRARGVGHAEHRRVGVCLPRSVNTVVAVLAILKAGAAYVPLDASHPRERLAFMLADTVPAALLTDEQLAEHLGPLDSITVLRVDADSASIAVESTARLCVRVAASDPAYVMYTSGSTGTPKGVVVPHRAVVRLVRGTDYVQLRPADRIAFASDFCFDAATFELWGALLNGASVVGVDRETLLAPRALASVIAEQAITVLFVTTALFNQYARELPHAFGQLRTLLFGGEAVDPRAVTAVLASSTPPARLLHVYGPTESTTFATWFEVGAAPPDGETVPIGSPIANTRAYVLDSHLRPTAWGTTGELYLGGDGLAIGYLNQPTLTAERFIVDPFTTEPGARLYRTGDRVYHRPDGQLVFAGRVDDQVKIRGFRVEPGEIEVALADHPGVRQAVVVAREEEGVGTRQLVAYVVSVGAPLSATELRRHLASKLPEPMLPAAFVSLSELPLTPAGKLDRRALSAVVPARVITPDSVAPRTALERGVERIWAEVLGLEHVGIRDNFFDLGGHSLLAVELFARLEEAYGLRLPLASLFPDATIERQVELLDQAARPASRSIVPIQPLGRRRPIICVHAIDGDVLRFAPLARQLGLDQPFFGLRARGLDPGSDPVSDVHAMATGYVDDLLRAGFTAPFYLSGFSSGASVAFEMARELTERGYRVALLALVDGRAPVFPAPRAERVWRGLENLPHDLWAYAADAFGQRGLLSFVQLKALGLPSWAVRQFGRQPRGWQAVDAVAGLSDRHMAVAQAQYAALSRYRPQAYAGRVSLFRARVRLLLSSHDRDLGWQSLARGGVDVYRVGGAHADLLREPAVRELADALRRAIARAQTACGE